MKRLILIAAAALCVGCATPVGKPVDGPPQLDAGIKWSPPVVSAARCTFGGKELKGSVFIGSLPSPFAAMVTGRLAMDGDMVFQMSFVQFLGYTEVVDVYIKTQHGWRKLEGKELDALESTQTMAFKRQVEETLGVSLGEAASCMRGTRK